MSRNSHVDHPSGSRMMPGRRTNAHLGSNMFIGYPHFHVLRGQELHGWKPRCNKQRAAAPREAPQQHQGLSGATAAIAHSSSFSDDRELINFSQARSSSDGAHAIVAQAFARRGNLSKLCRHVIVPFPGFELCLLVLRFGLGGRDGDSCLRRLPSPSSHSSSLLGVPCLANDSGVV